MSSAVPARVSHHHRLVLVGYATTILATGLATVSCSGSTSSAPEDFSGLADTKADSPAGWVFRGRMLPGSKAEFSYSVGDRYQGVLLTMEQGEGDFAARITSVDGEPWCSW